MTFSLLFELLHGITSCVTYVTLIIIQSHPVCCSLCRSFRAIGDEAFMKAFEDTTLPFEDWTHEAHIRMAFHYLQEYGRQDAEAHIKWVLYVGISIWHFVVSWGKHVIITFIEYNKLIMFDHAWINGVSLDHHLHIHCIGYVSSLSFRSWPSSINEW